MSCGGILFGSSANGAAIPQPGPTGREYAHFGFQSLISLALPLQPPFPCAVAKLKNFLKYWLPVLLWMGVIFSASGDTKSLEHSSRIIAPFLRFFFPNLQPATVEEVVFLVRKCAHLTEYAVMALLFWRALRKLVRGASRPWQWSEARMAILLVALYAATDELHQLFVPSRQALVTDVMIDTIGGIAGVVLLWGVGRLLRKW